MRARMAVRQPNWNLLAVPSTSFSNVYENVQLNRLLVGDRRSCGKANAKKMNQRVPQVCCKLGTTVC